MCTKMSSRYPVFRWNEQADTVKGVFRKEYVEKLLTNHYNNIKKIHQAEGNVDKRASLLPFCSLFYKIVRENSF